jgi:hypothetical protein
MPEAMIDVQPNLEDLQSAVEDPRWAFRTIDGIARDLGAAPEDVAELLTEHPEVARKSVFTDREGNELYTARDRSPTIRERIERFRSVL